jgi:hypothetical protein
MNLELKMEEVYLLVLEYAFQSRTWERRKSHKLEIGNEEK